MGNLSSFKGITDSFTLRVQNDKFFVIAKPCKRLRQSVFPFQKIKSFYARAARAPYFCTDRNRGKSRRKPYGLGFRTFPNDQRDKLPFGNLYCIEVQYVPINNEDEKTFCSSVIAVRVSGGHLCEAEAPTEPAGETAVRCAAIRSLPFSSLRSRLNGCGNPFPQLSLQAPNGVRSISFSVYNLSVSDKTARLNCIFPVIFRKIGNNTVNRRELYEQTKYRKSNILLSGGGAYSRRLCP